MKNLCVSTALIVSLLLFIDGCGSVKERKRIQTFQDDIEAYGKLIRWGDYEGAATYLRGPDRASEPVDTQTLKEIRVTSYKMTGSEVLEDGTKAIVYVNIEFYNERQGRLKSIKDQQHWWYEDEVKQWYLDGSLPDFEAQQ